MVDDLHEVIEHVGVERPQLLRDERTGVTGDEPTQRDDERHRTPLELEHLPLELVDGGAVDVLVAVEDRLLDVGEVGAEFGVDLQVGVDDEVEHGVHDGERPETQPFGTLLEVGPQPGERVGLPVADREDEPVTDEHHELAGLHVARGLDVPQRLEGDEDVVLVEVDLGALIAGEDVLHGERMQVEFVVDGGELLAGGVLDPDPQEALAPFAEPFEFKIIKKYTNY